MDFRIPNEKGKITTLMFSEALREGYQLPFTKAAAKSGDYRKWISSMTEEQLNGFIQKNEAIMTNRLVPIQDPKWDLFKKTVYRNCLYTTELYLRHNTDTVRLDEDLQGYYAEWEGKFKRAEEEWLVSLKPEDLKPVEKSEINPFY